MEVTVTKKSDTEVVVSVSIPTKTLEEERSSVLKELGKDISVKGFRSGHIPDDVVKKHIGEDKILESMASHSINKVIPSIFKEHELQVIGQPQVRVTKMALGNPLEFTVTATILPNIKLPDYKKIAGTLNKDKPSVQNVTDEEVEKAIENIRKSVVNANQQHTPNTKEKLNTKQSTNNLQQEEKKELPELTDEFVQKLGPYKDVQDFKTKLREQLKTRKEQMTHEKHRLSIVENIIKETKLSVPDLLIDAELDKMVGQMRADIDRIGMKPEDYFAQIKKTEEDLRKEWRSDAKKRATIQMILNNVAEAEKITPDEKEVDGQTQAILKQHPPKEENRKHAEIATRIYVATMLMNEKVFQFLEQQILEQQK